MKYPTRDWQMEYQGQRTMMRVTLDLGREIGGVHGQLSNHLTRYGARLARGLGSAVDSAVGGAAFGLHGQQSIARARLGASLGPGHARGSPVLSTREPTGPRIRSVFIGSPVRPQLSLRTIGEEDDSRESAAARAPATALTLT